jgi:hypothetical protein
MKSQVQALTNTVAMLSTAIAAAAKEHGGGGGGGGGGAKEASARSTSPATWEHTAICMAITS